MTRTILQKFREKRNYCACGFGHLLTATIELSFIKLQKLRYTVSTPENFRQENTAEVNKGHFCSQMCFYKKKKDVIYNQFIPVFQAELHTKLLSRAMLFKISL